MRPHAHLKLAEFTLGHLGRMLNQDEQAGILIGARDADTMLGDITLAHYFDGRTNQGPALNNIMKQLEKKVPLAMGVAVHLIQDVSLPVHSAPLEFVRHFIWEGYLDRNIERLIEQIMPDDEIADFQPDIYAVCQEVASRSSGLLGDMIDAWPTDKELFAHLCCECLQLGDSGSTYILRNWKRI